MIEPVNSFKEASPAKKAAIVGGVAAGAAAVGSLAYAVKNGKVNDKTVGDIFKKAEEGAEQVGLGDKVKLAGQAIRNGYEQLGTAIKTKAGELKGKVTGFFSKSAEEAPASNPPVA